jgi:two-component system phosphate regulon sensor histidine kinase PhoR
MRRKQLLWQLYPAYLVIALVALSAMTWYASAALRGFYRDRTAEDLQARAMLLDEPVRAALAAGDWPQVDRLCKQLGAKSQMRITVVLPDGKVVGDTREAPESMYSHADRPEVVDALALGTGKSLRYSHTLQEDELYVGTRIDQAGRALGVLRTAVSLAAIDRALRAVQGRLLAGGLLTVLLVAVVTLVISRRITRPLAELRRGAERFGRGELSHRLPIADSEEIAALAETLNQMAAELEEKLHVVVRERNEREAMLASMVEGVLAFDAQERLLRLNRAAGSLLGVAPERATGRTLHELVRNVRLQQLVAEVLASGEPRADAIVLQSGAGSKLDVQVALLRDSRGEMVGALVVLHDVSRLERLERVRRDFVANVSHELRTPITSIKGYVETLLDGAMNAPEQLERFLRIVAAQTDRLGAIIEDLLSLARIEEDAERSAIPLATGRIKPILQAAIEVCHVKAQEKSIAVELACDDDLQAPVSAALLEQAVVNLVDNAINYSPAGQTVHVEAERFEREVAVRVRDQGCGIGREHLPRIFERFYRVDRARSRKLGGTGLGLAIVKHIAEVHGGQVTVESTLGEGTTFSLHLPSGEGSETQTGGVRPRQPEGRIPPHS